MRERRAVGDSKPSNPALLALGPDAQRVSRQLNLPPTSTWSQANRYRYARLTPTPNPYLILHPPSHPNLVRRTPSKHGKNNRLRGLTKLDTPHPPHPLAFFGNSEEFWLNAQREVDLWEGARVHKEDLKRITPAIADAVDR